MDTFDRIPSAFPDDDLPVSADQPLEPADVDLRADDEVPYRAGEAMPPRDFYSRKLCGRVDLLVRTSSGTSTPIPNFHLTGKRPARDEIADHVNAQVDASEIAVWNFRETQGTP